MYVEAVGKGPVLGFETNFWSILQTGSAVFSPRPSVRGRFEALSLAQRAFPVGAFEEKSLI